MINLNRKTKIILAVAGAAAVVYLLSRPNKKSFLGLERLFTRKPDSAKRKKEVPKAPARPSYPASALPYGKVVSGQRKGWVVFFKNPRGVIYLPPGTEPYEIRGTWYVDLSGEAVAMTGPSARDQRYVDSLTPNF